LRRLNKNRKKRIHLKSNFLQIFSTKRNLKSILKKESERNSSLESSIEFLEYNFEELRKMFDKSGQLTRGELIKDKMKKEGFNFNGKIHEKKLKIKTFKTNFGF